VLVTRHHHQLEVRLVPRQHHVVVVVADDAAADEKIQWLPQDVASEKKSR